MLQPFELLKPVHLNRLIELKKNYLVSQTYKRAHDPFSEEQQIDLLFSDYDDIGLAKGHFQALRGDRFAAIIDLQKTEHCAKLKEMLAPESGYRLFWAVVRSKKELEDRITGKYKDHMKRYIQRNTSWRINRNTTIFPQLQVIYGELFIILKYGSETRRITFEELEKS